MFCWIIFGWWWLPKKVSGWKLEGLCVFLCLVLIRELELGSPTHLTTHVFNNFVRIFTNLSCETSTCSLTWELIGSCLHTCSFPAWTLGQTHGKASLEKSPFRCSISLRQLPASLSRDLRQVFAVRCLDLMVHFCVEVQVPVYCWRWRRIRQSRELNSGFHHTGGRWGWRKAGEGPRPQHCVPDAHPPAPCHVAGPQCLGCFSGCFSLSPFSCRCPRGGSLSRECWLPLVRRIPPSQTYGTSRVKRKTIRGLLVSWGDV